MATDTNAPADNGQSAPPPRVIQPISLQSYVDTVTGGIDRISGAAGKGIIPFLLAVATLLAFGALVMRLLPTAQLGAPEFVATLVLALSVFVFAGVMRYLEFRTGVELLRHQIWKDAAMVRARVAELENGQSVAFDVPTTDPEARAAGLRAAKALAEVDEEAAAKRAAILASN